MSRRVTKIILHCTASSAPNQDAAMITKWHKQRGFTTIGYHYLVQFNGLIEQGRLIDHAGAHAEGHNATSIGICLAGLKVEDFTEAQFRSLELLLRLLKKGYPSATLYAHNELTNKECPVFPIGKWKDLWLEIPG